MKLTTYRFVEVSDCQRFEILVVLARHEISWLGRPSLKKLQFLRRRGMEEACIAQDLRVGAWLQDSIHKDGGNGNRKRAK